MFLINTIRELLLIVKQIYIICDITLRAIHTYMYVIKCRGKDGRGEEVGMWEGLEGGEVEGYEEGEGSW